MIRARARCSRAVPVLAVPCSPALPFSGGDGGATYLRGGGFLPSRKCLSASSPPTPSNGYTFTLFRRHPCRHGRPSIRLQTIHMHYCERLVPFPAHDNSSSIQHLGDEGRAEPRELQLRSPCSFQRYVVDPYQLSRLVLSPLDLTVVVVFLVQRCPLQPRPRVPVRRPQSSLECGHVLAHCAGFLFRSQGCSIHSLDRKPRLPTQHHHVGGHSCARLWRRPVAHQDQWHELVPLLLRLSARRFQTSAQRPETPFYESVAPGVVGRSPRLVYPKQAAHLQYHFGSEIRALVAVQLPKSSVPSHNLEHQFSSDGGGLLVRDREALEPLREVAPHHKAVLVPGRSDRVRPGDVHGQSFHRHPDDVLVERLPPSPTSLQHRAVALVADPAHVGSHSRPVKSLLSQRHGARRAQMSSDHPSVEPLEQTTASVCRDDQLGPPSLSFQLVELSVEYSSH